MLFHAIDPDDDLFSHNVLINGGRVVAASAARTWNPSWPGIMSPYEAFTQERDKEEAFERVRASAFPRLPTRLGSIFLFPTRIDADRANAEWWDQRRIILEATVIAAISQGVFDARWLDSHANEWDSAARSYWSGAPGTDPRRECVVCGTIQLTGWEPFGRLLR